MMKWMVILIKGVRLKSINIVSQIQDFRICDEFSEVVEVLDLDVWRAVKQLSKEKP